MVRTTTAPGWPGSASGDRSGRLGWPAVPRGTDVDVVPVLPQRRAVPDPVDQGQHPEPAVTADHGPVVRTAGPELSPPDAGAPASLVETAGPGARPAAEESERVDRGAPTEEDPTAPAGDASRPAPVRALAPVSAPAPASARAPSPVLVGNDEAQRAEVARSLPDVDDSTPLAREVAEDARRRIALSGRRLAPPARTRVLTVANQKGGVGKTTTTVNIAAALAQAGLRVVVLDSDPQGNASTALGVEHHAEVPGLYDVLVDEVPLEDVLQPCPDVPGLLCAPATIDLAGAEIELVSMVARETRLRGAVHGYLERCRRAGSPAPDYVFVDCPPSLGLLTLNAFVCAEEVLIPIQCEYYALEGLSQLLKNIDMITRHLNPTLHVSSILLTMYDARTRLAAQVAEEVREHFPSSVLATTVPRSVRVSEAPSYGQTVMTYDPGSSGALSYLAAAQELAERPSPASAPAAGRR